MSATGLRDSALRAIARKEFAEFVRRPWILVLAGVLALLALGVSYAASLQAVGELGLASFTTTIVLLRVVVGLLIPIIAIILAYSALAGEQESGSLGLLLAQPVTRAEVLVGKYVGLLGVLAATLVLGFGVAGIVIGVRTAEAAWLDYARFILVTVLYTAAYFALFLALSAVSSNRNTALLLSLGTAFFYGLIFDWLRIILVRLIEGPQFLGSGQGIPLWFRLLDFLSVPDLYSQLMVAANATLRPDSSATGVEALLAGPWAAATYSLGLIAWAGASLAVAWYALKRKDV